MTATTGHELDHLVVATGPSVRIRRKVRADADDDYRWRTNPENARYDGEPALQQSFEAFLQQVESELAFGRPEMELFTITDGSGRHIGNVMYYHADSFLGEAEFGLTLGDDADRGRRFGTEAAVLFMRFLWQNYPFRRVYLHTLAWNERAIACFRRSGFNEVSRLMRDGEPFVRMEARREWWLLWDAEGRFAAYT
ncbi:MAG: GNAT family N-acetyltransferase [Anaerolineaceae bacterium]